MSKSRKKKGEFVHIGSFISNVLQKCRIDADDTLLKVLDIWENTVGSMAAQHTRPAAFKKRTLVVHVEHSTLIHQLQFDKNLIISKLNEQLKKEAIDEIVFRIGQGI